MSSRQLLPGIYDRYQMHIYGSNLLLDYICAHFAYYISMIDIFCTSTTACYSISLWNAYRLSARSLILIPDVTCISINSVLLDTYYRYQMHISRSLILCIWLIVPMHLVLIMNVWQQSANKHAFDTYCKYLWLLSRKCL